MAEWARDLIRQVCQSREVVIIPGSGFTGSHTYAAVGAAGLVAGETGTIRQGPLQQDFAGGVPGTAKAVLRPAHVGARRFLRDGGRGGRSDD